MDGRLVEPVDQVMNAAEGRNPRRSRGDRDIAPPNVTRAGVPRGTASVQAAATRSLKAPRRRGGGIVAPPPRYIPDGESHPLPVATGRSPSSASSLIVCPPPALPRMCPGRVGRSTGWDLTTVVGHAVVAGHQEPDLLRVLAAVVVDKGELRELDAFPRWRELGP